MELAKRLALAFAALVVLLLIANFVMQTRTELQLQARIAAIRAAGDPASIADLAPVSIPADQNAAATLAKVAPRLDKFADEYGTFYNSPLGKAFEEAKNRGEAATAEQLAAIRAIVDKYPELDQSLAKAVRQQYASQLNFALDQPRFLNQILGLATNFRSAARFIDWRIKVLLADGDYEQAVEQGIELLRLARLQESEPTTVNYLVVVAIRGVATRALYDALAAGPISPELHAAVEAELARADDPQRLADAFKSERAVSISFFDDVPNQLNPLVSRIISWPMKRHCVGMLDYYEQLLAYVGPTKSRVFPPATNDRGPMADLALPAFQATCAAAARDDVTIRAMRIFNALTLFRDQNGREATGLDELPIPKDATIDPFSGQPLKLKHTDDGWIIYSVMENGIDDDGDFTDMKDYGLAPPRLRNVSPTPSGEPE